MNRSGDEHNRDTALAAALVRFVNLRIRTTAQVERLFRQAAGQPAETFQTIPPGDVDSYRRIDQNRAHNWLLRVIALDRGRLSQAEAEQFQQKIGGFVVAKVRKVPRAVYGRRFRLEWAPTLDGVEICIGYATALLLADPRLRWRIGFCALEECKRFFFDPRSQGGRRMQYCCPRHSELGRKRAQRLRRSIGQPAGRSQS